MHPWCAYLYPNRFLLQIIWGREGDRPPLLVPTSVVRVASSLLDHHWEAQPHHALVQAPAAGLSSWFIESKFDKGSCDSRGSFSYGGLLEIGYGSVEELVDEGV